MKKEITYKEALIELEDSINRIENEDVSVDELSTLVKRVAFLLKFCKDTLYATESEISDVLNQIDEDEKTA